MKVISINTWWGCKADGLFKFITSNASTDVFCLQEILRDGKGLTDRNELKDEFEHISKLLPEHTDYYFEYMDGSYYGKKAKDPDFKFGVACFVKSKLKQRFVEGTQLYDPEIKWNDYSGRLAVGAAMGLEVEDYAIVNLHGLWQGGIKEDTDAKTEQNQKIFDLLAKMNGKKVVCGDFNLVPETKSIRMLSDKYRNLAKEYKIANTRSTLYRDEPKCVDYIFVDNNITVHDFSVPNVTVSDHLPLVIDFD